MTRRSGPLKLVEANSEAYCATDRYGAGETFLRARSAVLRVLSTVHRARVNVIARPRPIGDDDLAFIERIGDVLLPRTQTPGATDLGLGRMVAETVTACCAPKDTDSYIRGLRVMRRRVGRRDDAGLLAAMRSSRTAVSLDRRYFAALTRQLFIESYRQCNTGPGAPKRSDLGADWFVGSIPAETR